LDLLTDIDKIRIVEIEEVIQETPTIRTLIFQDPLSHKSLPGQFLMIWIPRAEELPMSAMIIPKRNYAAITVRKYGFGSTSLYEKRIGDVIGIRGPYGNSFTISKNSKHMLIGGGTGLVPLMRLAYSLKNRQDDEITFILGSRSKEEVLFEERAKNILSKINGKIIITTEDGTYGMKGNVIDALIDQLRETTVDHVYTCGPELMMRRIYEICKTNSIPIQASLERYMKCGIGICSSCCINDRLVCVDGTVFNAEQLDTLPDFGKYYRDKSGEKIGY
jgi:dihydroorotate dehydrogenase electron transfer subunit